MKINNQLVNKELNKRNVLALEQLHNEYSDGLVRFAEGFLFNRQSAEDVVQNLFVYLWDKAEVIKFDTSIKSYLYQSVRNRCLNVIRNLKVQDSKELLFIEATINSQNVNDNFDEELFAKLEKAMEELPEKMLEVFKLKYVEGKKNSEIAKQLEIAESTIKTQLRRAKDKIGKYFLSAIIISFLLEKNIS